MPNSTDDDKCKVVAWSFVLTIIVGVFIYSGVKEIQYQQIEETKCQVNSVQIPSKFPPGVNWKSCDCGTDCTSYSPCIKIFLKQGNNSNGKMIEPSNRISSSRCSIYDSHCNAYNYQKKINSANSTKNNYENKEIKCFYDKMYKKYYLKRDSSHQGELIVFGILSFFTAIAVFYNCVYTYCEEKTEEDKMEEKNKKAQEISNV
tara:strand:+ start:131 stop:739 length:609 start_codon:yes stop_codon:yes gene_type:complete